MLEESNIAGQQLLTSHGATDAISAAASRAQPATDKLRAYQQHVSRIVADTQIEMARVTEEHAPITSRTARDLADQVAKVAADETEKSSVKQQEILKSFRDPFERHGAGHQNGGTGARGNLQSGSYGANGSADADAKHASSFQGSEQGVHSSQPAGGKGSTKQN